MTVVKIRWRDGTSTERSVGRGAADELLFFANYITKKKSPTNGLKP